MIPVTFPSAINPATGNREMLVSFLSDVTGLTRWIDYIPVKTIAGSLTNEGTTNTGGYQAIKKVSYLSTMVPFLDYVPVYEDLSATLPFSTDAGGYIPVCTSGGENGFLDLVFDGTAIDPRITFTRASTATYIDRDGLIKTAAANEMRRSLDPVTGRMGALIEEQRTNLLTYSEQFDNAAWAKTRATVSANATTAPDGTLTADKLVEDTTASSDHYTQQLVTVTNATAYTGSIYLKAAERTKCDVVVYRGATFGGVLVDLTAGTISAPQTGGVTNLLTTSRIEPVGLNGWYRVIITFTSDGTQSTVRPMLSNGSTTGYTGNGTSGLYIWGAQLEAGAFPTSYIPTTAAQVTRAADVPRMTEANFSSWYNQSEGTFVFNGSVDTANNDCRLFCTTTGTAQSDYIGIRTTGVDTVAAYIRNTSVSQTIVSASVASRSPFKSCIAYKNNYSAASFNGSIATEDATVSVPNVNAFVLGAAGDYSKQGLVVIHSIVYYPKRLSNAQLQALSTQ